MIGTAVIFTLDNYAAWWADEVFQTLCVRRYLDQPVGLLSFYIGHLWTEIFGFSVLNLRLLVSIETTLSLGIAAYYLFRLTRNRLLTGICFLLGCLMMKATSFPLYNWDTGTYLFDSISICLLISVIRNPSLAKYMLLGLTIGLITLGRLPSGIFLPLSMAVIILARRYRNEKRGTLRALLTVFAGWLLTILILTWLICGSPLGYINLFFENDVVTGHSPVKDNMRLFYRFLGILQRITTIWTPGIGCMLLAVIFPRIKKNSSLFIILLLWLGLCALLADALTRKELFFTSLLGGDAPIGLGLLITYPVYLLFSRDKENRILILELWAIFFLYFSMAFGSDAYMERMTAGFSIPLIIALLWLSDIRKIRRYLRYFLFMALMTFCTLFAVQTVRIKRGIDYNGIVYNDTPYQGIKAHPGVNEYLQKWDKAIPYLQKKGIPFAPLGDHIPLELVYGTHQGLPFNEFQEVLYENNGWKIYGEYYLKNVDAFVFPYDDKRVEASIIEAIKGAGFTDSIRMGDAIILYRSDLGEISMSRQR